MIWSRWQDARTIYRIFPLAATCNKMRLFGRKQTMNHNPIVLLSICAAALVAGAILTFVSARPAFAADEPLTLARDGFMYVGGKTMAVQGRDFVYGQMYVEIRIPAKQTHPYPIIMVHGGTMSGTNFT